ncbi:MULTISPECIES: hypothetical protein [unclassified Thiocapsa]|uniref:hypothetical protein n=1 Tax=unclassified Thiocapsa TaxID=2641286 RepID=UPI0035B4D960
MKIIQLRVPRAATVTTDCDVGVYRLRAEASARMEQEASEIAMVFHRFMMEMTADRFMPPNIAVKTTMDQKGIGIATTVTRLLCLARKFSLPSSVVGRSFRATVCAVPGRQDDPLRQRSAHLPAAGVGSLAGTGILLPAGCAARRRALAWRFRVPNRRCQVRRQPLRSTTSGSRDYHRAQAAEAWAQGGLATRGPRADHWSHLLLPSLRPRGPR